MKNKRLMKSLSKAKDKEPNLEIQTALRHIANEFMKKSEKETILDTVKSLWRTGFDLMDPSGNKKIGSKVIQQCLWRVRSKYQFLDFQLHSSDRSEEAERITTDGIATILNNGKMMQMFRDKGGVFMNQFLDGDAFLLMGKNSDKETSKESPLSFQVLRHVDVYPETYANGIRGTRPSTKLAIIFSYTKDHAYALWPELEENNVIGRIAGSYQKSDIDDEMEHDGGVVEICWFFNLITNAFTKFAGSTAYELESYSGKEYPWRKRKKAYIPVFQFICQAADEGFYNYGLAEMIYDLAVITAKMFNLELAHAEKMVYPLTVFQAPAGKADELIRKMAMAYKARDAGKDPFIAMDFGANSGNAMQTQSLVAQNLFNEWQAVWQTLTKELSRLGIYIDDVDRGVGYTATQVYAEEDASSAFTKDIGEFNASETKELIECAIELIKDTVSEKNDTKINMKTQIVNDDGSKTKLPTTYGNLVTELKQGDYFVEVNSKTGSVPSNTMKLAHIERKISMTQPGTPEMAMLYKEHSAILGVDLKETSQPMPQQMEGGPVNSQTAVKEAVNQQMPAPQTGRQELRPRGQKAIAISKM